MELVHHHGMCHLDLQWDVRPEAAFNHRLASFSRLILFDRRGRGASERMAKGVPPTAEGWSEGRVSRTVTDLVAGSSLSFADHGQVELTGVPGIWELFTPIDDRP